MTAQTLFSEDYLLRRWAAEYEEYLGGDADEWLLARLTRWDGRDRKQTETQAEGAFTRVFFQDLWGYWASGERDDGAPYCMRPQEKVGRAGQAGGTGSADLALGWFGRSGIRDVPVVLCEFKDIRSSLDAPQNRKGNNRSPVGQCLDYLRYAFDQVDLPRAIELPTWGLVTDMNEFRLYSRRGGLARFQRFVVKRRENDSAPGGALLAPDEDGKVRRFLFSRLFHRDSLLGSGGRSPLDALLDEQWVQDRDLEQGFYKDYSAFRAVLYDALVTANPRYRERRGRLVRVAQRLLDRFLFILFCEDMGDALGFPRNLLRRVLETCSRDPFYHEGDGVVWTRVRQLFLALRDGTPFARLPIPRFNGGLFADDAELDQVFVPSRVFCARGQGVDEQSLEAHHDTLLYLAARYNFATRGARRERAIGLYTVGRIFEQSITDLEVMEAKAEGRESLAEITRRRQDGVYYTPEWVTSYLVQETVGTRLAELREEAGLSAVAPVSDDEILAWREAAASMRTQARFEPVTRYREALGRYNERLNTFRVLDPACGSGAFLIQAFNLLVAERRWLAEEWARVARRQEVLFERQEISDRTIERNLYGVDTNPESVEITRLALWLHTARPGRPLCRLEHNIRCGNSLVGPEFERYYEDRHGRLYATEAEAVRDRINVFDWHAAFPEVFARGGFDCVVGNPPYVKLQHYRRVQSDVSEFLAGARTPDGRPTYRSAQTGNIDLYLPFIEKGMSLLAPSGRMGYIAPSLWALNEYGEGLRALVRETRRLDRWVDFKSFQVFDDATTYTALQFFTGKAQDRIRYVIHPGADLSAVDWGGGVDELPYGELPETGAWTFVPGRERAFLDRLRMGCLPLGDPSVTSHIFQGLITSADAVYHLRRVAPGRYRVSEDGDGPVHEIEDALMRPLVSGEDAHRYELPAPVTHILFPYDLTGPRPRLFTASEMQARFPKGWTYLEGHAAALRCREDHSFDDDQWYRFGRNQNLDKQERPKLLVPRLVHRLFAAPDLQGRFFLDNVDVGGVLAAVESDLPYLLALLNSPVCDFFWYRISKPFRGHYRSANKQFIAPLPIPRASDAEKAEVAELARALQEAHSRRRDLVALLDKRLSSTQARVRVHAPDWLFGEIPPAPEWESRAPPGLKGAKRASWILQQQLAEMATRCARLADHLGPGVDLQVETSDGEVRIVADGLPILEGVFVPAEQAPFLAASWRQALRGLNPARGVDPVALFRSLLRVSEAASPAFLDSVVKLDAEIRSADQAIAGLEAQMNERTYRLYGLSPEERAMVEKDRVDRGGR